MAVEGIDDILVRQEEDGTFSLDISYDGLPFNGFSDGGQVHEQET